MGGDRGEGEKYFITPTPPSPLKGEGLIFTPLIERDIKKPFIKKTTLPLFANLI
jgi:hypothetical protein